MSDCGKNKPTISGVECNVTQCIHNNCQNHCTAGCIQIGPRSACTCSETICESFQAQD